MKTLKSFRSWKALAGLAPLETRPQIDAKERAPPKQPCHASTFGNTSGSICRPKTSLLN